MSINTKFYSKALTRNDLRISAPVNASRSSTGEMRLELVAPSSGNPMQVMTKMKGLLGKGLPPRSYSEGY